MTRITCPACGAAYEVPASAIPVGGRDVQCSGCGHDWFQLWPPPGMTLYDSAGLGMVAGAAVVTGAGRGHDPAPGPGFGEAPSARYLPDLPPDEIVFGSQPARDGPPPRRPIDPAVLAVLRAEAETETEARRREAAQPLESQPELPLPAVRRSAAADLRARLARLQEAERRAPRKWTESGDSPADPAEPDPLPGISAAGRPFPPLPPIATPEPAPRPPGHPPQPERAETAEPVVGDAATAVLLPAPLRPGDVAVMAKRRARRGFRIGFAVPVLAAALGLALYLAAPQLSLHLPQAAPALATVMRHGEAIQDRLASQIRQVLVRLAAAPPGES